MFEDFYEPSEFDSQIEDFKKYLRDTVRAEILEELESLRKENESLRDIKNRIREIECEHNMAMHNARQEVMRMKFAAIVKACSTVYYSPMSYRMPLPKCDRCNDERMIEYTTPLGKPAKEPCTCHSGLLRYKPQPNYVSEIAKLNGEIITWHKPYDDGDGYCVSWNIKPENVYDDKDFSEIKNQYHAYFRNEDMCQAYCDWLNVRQENKEKDHETD